MKEDCCKKLKKLREDGFLDQQNSLCINPEWDESITIKYCPFCGKNLRVGNKITEWYKIDIELFVEGEWKVIHRIPSFEFEEFNDNFARFVDKQLEGLYGRDRMVIYYDNERNLRELEERIKLQKEKKESSEHNGEKKT